MNACPVCHAAFKNKALCHRCKTDVTLLLDIEQEVRNCIIETETRAAKGDYAAMLCAAEQAQALKQSPQTDKALAYAALLNGHFERAWRLFQKSTKP